ncbi:hypothetical protein ACLB2K_029066 [Fragaria x ananassa]
MISGKDVYEVLASIVPLYVAMILAYGSVRWWKIFTLDQCLESGDFRGSISLADLFQAGPSPRFWSTPTLIAEQFPETAGAKLLIAEQFPETAGAITSFLVDSDIVSLNGREPLQTDAEIGEDGKLHVVVRRSSASAFVSHGWNSMNSGMTPRASNLTGVEIYSVQSSLEPTPRQSSFNQSEFFTMFNASPKHGYTNSFQGVTPRTSNYEPEMIKMSNKKRRVKSMSGELLNAGIVSSYPPPNPLSLGSEDLREATEEAVDDLEKLS